MQIKIIYVTDHTPHFYQQAFAEYKKRLSPYCKIKILSIKPGQSFKKHIAQRDHVIGVQPGKNQFSSIAFANKINQWGVDGISHLVFLIGDHELDLNKPSEYMSLSQMKMAVDIQGLILVEQIYRGFSILNNKPYHK